MPNEETADRNGMALALSGGGFRATLYHLGTIIRLNELGLLTKLERISSVSGGSILTGMLAAAWTRLKVKDGIITNLDAEVGAPIRAFCTRTVDVFAFGFGALIPGVSVADMLADAYDDLYKGISLQALPDKPQFVFNATNLQTGRLVRLQKARLADYTIGEIPNPSVRLAVAVAASSAFPPVLSPVTIKIAPNAWTKRDGAIHHGDPAYTRVLSLTDGGAYDNLGLETIDDFKSVIVSDAGAPFAVESEAGTVLPKQLMRVLDIATDQARGLRKRMLHATRVNTAMSYAYSGIDGDASAFPAPRQLQASPAITAPLARLRTRLSPFSDQEQGQLINWGWYMTDLAVRSYIAKTAPAPGKWPAPAWPLG